MSCVLCFNREGQPEQAVSLVFFRVQITPAKCRLGQTPGHHGNLVDCSRLGSRQYARIVGRLRIPVLGAVRLGPASREFIPEKRVSPRSSRSAL